MIWLHPLQQDSKPFVCQHSATLICSEIVVNRNERGTQVSRMLALTSWGNRLGNILPFHMFFVSLLVTLKNPGSIDISGKLSLTYGAVVHFSPLDTVCMFVFCLLSGTWCDQSIANCLCFHSPWSSSVIQELSVRDVIKMTCMLECGWYSMKRSRDHIKRAQVLRGVERGCWKYTFWWWSHVNC